MMSLRARTSLYGCAGFELTEVFGSSVARLMAFPLLLLPSINATGLRLWGLIGLWVGLERNATRICESVASNWASKPNWLLRSRFAIVERILLAHLFLLDRIYFSTFYSVFSFVLFFFFAFCLFLHKSHNRQKIAIFFALKLSSQNPCKFFILAHKVTSCCVHFNF